eukprot:TRINITY_DN13398_c0_g1_i1.p3 TRINITY_DN13398_c0_g1~~TRINITY_DN13398_c0_g1_i1.p3  ORF type:complete len:103 (-),score=4.82 TRINITY_DN13398_c0_g1_i1:1241-1549(-)
MSNSHVIIMTASDDIQLVGACPRSIMTPGGHGSSRTATEFTAIKVGPLSTLEFRLVRSPHVPSFCSFGDVSNGSASLWAEYFLSGRPITRHCSRFVADNALL